MEQFSRYTMHAIYKVLLVLPVLPLPTAAENATSFRPNLPPGAVTYHYWAKSLETYGIPS